MNAELTMWGSISKLVLRRKRSITAPSPRIHRDLLRNSEKGMRFIFLSNNPKTANGEAQRPPEPGAVSCVHELYLSSSGLRREIAKISNSDKPEPKRDN